MKTKLRVTQCLLTTMALAHGLSTTFLDRRDCLDLLSLLPLTTMSTLTASSSSSSATATTFPTMPNVPITDKVFFDVRVARQDGSTYVRDDLPDTFENRVLTARLVFGLYGTLAPNHVEQFLKYIVPPQENGESSVENPYPSYSRSTFTALDQETGLLQGGYVPSLRVTDIGGSTAITYGSRVLPATLWIDKPSSSSSSSSSTANNGRLSHSVPGLLTHKQLDVTPSFGITTRASPQLDATHTVFGQVLWDEATLVWFRQLQDIPTYSIDRPVGYDEFQTGGMATSVFNAQREFFRGAAKAAGDTRVSKLYQGKLMRRMEVMQVGKL
jgi:cyclophilin family peptidyl-prolyl cis-trans isomerase